jgi:ABC-type molybdate transport system substrate-binding protein
MFQKTAAGKDVDFSQSYGASGEQTRAVKAGLDADIVALSLAPDMDELVAAGKVDAKWKKQSYKGMVTDSVVVFVVRDGNPKKIKSWNDLLRPGIEIVTPNPFTSGGARWNIMAAYGSWRKQGKTDKQAQANLLKLWKNVVVQDTSARAALNTFNSGKGDVMLAYENEAYFSRMQGLDLAVGHPQDDDPHREPDRRHEGHVRQEHRERVPPLPSNAGRSAGVRRLRLPAGREERGEREPQEVPRSPRSLHHRPARARRLGRRAEALLRPELEHHGALPEDRRREHRLTDVAVSGPRSTRVSRDRAGTALSLGFVTTFLMVFVGLPLAALMWEATSEGLAVVLGRGVEPRGGRALKLTVGASLGVSV